MDFSEYKNLSKFEKIFLNEFLNDVEKRENSQWNKNWDFHSYQNAFSGYEYNGLNQMMLDIVCKSQGLSDPRFATFNQAKENDYHVERGSKGVPLQFFTFINQRTKKPWNEKEFQEQSKNMTQEQKLAELKNKIPMAKTFHVFHARNLISNKNGLSLIENEPLKQFTKNINTNEFVDRFEENLIKNMEVRLVQKHSQGAYYTPATDQVTMPLKEQFNSYEERMAVLLHELGHATGHEKRLNRDLTGTFGSSKYSKEEMKVEMNSVFMTNILGLNISEEQRENHLTYLDSWGKAIRNDPKEFLGVLKDSLKIKDFMIEKGRFKEMALEDENQLQHDIDPNEFEALAENYKIYTNEEFDTDDTLEDVKKQIIEEHDYKMPLAYTEDYDHSGLIQYDIQSSYDLKTKIFENTLDSPYVTITSSDTQNIESMTQTLQYFGFEDFVSFNNFQIDREDLSDVIKLAAYTGDKEYLTEFISEHEHITDTKIEFDIKSIALDKNYLLRDLDEDTLSYFEEKGVTISEDFIHDKEYKLLCEYQLSHGEKITENSHSIEYEVEGDEDHLLSGSYKSYKDLWEDNIFESRISSDLDLYTLDEIENNKFIRQANPNLLERLGKNYSHIGKSLMAAKKDMKQRKEGEMDLDGDGIPSRNDVDDNRQEVQTNADLNKVGAGTSKSQTQENKKDEIQKRKPRTR